MRARRRDQLSGQALQQGPAGIAGIAGTAGGRLPVSGPPGSGAATGRGDAGASREPPPEGAWRHAPPLPGDPPVRRIEIGGAILVHGLDAMARAGQASPSASLAYLAGTVAGGGRRVIGYDAGTGSGRRPTTFLTTAALVGFLLRSSKARAPGSPGAGLGAQVAAEIGAGEERAALLAVAAGRASDREAAMARALRAGERGRMRLAALVASLSAAAADREERADQLGEDAVMARAMADAELLDRSRQTAAARSEAQLLRIELDTRNAEIASLRAALTEANERAATGGPNEGPGPGDVTH